MKKIALTFSFIFLFMTGTATADLLRGFSLGFPSTLVDDEFVIDFYPAAVQMFPGSLFAVIGPAPGAYSLGFSYIGSDLVGVSGWYQNGISTLDFDIPAGSSTVFGTTINADPMFAGAYFATIDADEHVNMLAYGIKAGSFYAGLGMQNTFWQNPVVNITKDSNGHVSFSETLGGFKTMLKPSAVLDLGSFRLYTALSLALDLRTYSIKSAPETNEINFSPDFLSQIGGMATALFDLNDKSKGALTVVVNNYSAGYGVTAFTQGNKDAKDIHTNWVQNEFEVSVQLGYRRELTPKAVLMIDIPFGIHTGVSSSPFGYAGYWSGVNLNTLYRITTWTIPTVRLAGEFEIFKNFTFRLSAQPTWESEVVEYASYDQLAAGLKTVGDTYGVSTALGLGYKIGQFSFSGLLNVNWFTAAFQNPLNNFGELFDNGANTTVFGLVQANYYFE